MEGISSDSADKIRMNWNLNWIDCVQNGPLLLSRVSEQVSGQWWGTAQLLALKLRHIMNDILFLT